MFLLILLPNQGLLMLKIGQITGSAQVCPMFQVLADCQLLNTVIHFTHVILSHVCVTQCGARPQLTNLFQYQYKRPGISYMYVGLAAAHILR